MTPQDFDALWENQEGACAICRVPFATKNEGNIDHDHDTGAVRGILCNRCNMALGFFNDNLARLQAAITYLKIERPSRPPVVRRQIGEDTASPAPCYEGGVSIREAARLMKRSERAIWKMVDQGRIQHYKSGRRRLVVLDSSLTAALRAADPSAVALDNFNVVFGGTLTRQEQRHQQERADWQERLRQRDERIGRLEAENRHLKKQRDGVLALAEQHAPPD